MISVDLSSLIQSPDQVLANAGWVPNDNGGYTSTYQDGAQITQDEAAQIASTQVSQLEALGYIQPYSNEQTAEKFGFASLEAYNQWIFGGGQMVNDATYGQLFQLPPGGAPGSFKHIPLIYTAPTDIIGNLLPVAFGIVVGGALTSAFLASDMGASFTSMLGEANTAVQQAFGFASSASDVASITQAASDVSQVGQDVLNAGSEAIDTASLADAAVQSAQSAADVAQSIKTAAEAVTMAQDAAGVGQVTQDLIDALNTAASALPAAADMQAAKDAAEAVTMAQDAAGSGEVTQGLLDALNTAGNALTDAAASAPDAAQAALDAQTAIDNYQVASETYTATQQTMVDAASAVQDTANVAKVAGVTWGEAVSLLKAAGGVVKVALSLAGAYKRVTAHAPTPIMPIAPTVTSGSAVDNLASGAQSVLSAVPWWALALGAFFILK